MLSFHLFKFKGVNVQLREDASFFFVQLTDINQTINHFFSRQPPPPKENIDDDDVDDDDDDDDVDDDGDGDGDDDDDHDDDDDDSGLRDEYLLKLLPKLE